MTAQSTRLTARDAVDRSIDSGGDWATVENEPDMVDALQCLGCDDAWPSGDIADGDDEVYCMTGSLDGAAWKVRVVQ